MQKLKIEHKNTKKDRRPGKGWAVALSRSIYRLQNTDTFYVESETSDNDYYFVKFKPDVSEEYSQCSCKDNSTRHTIKCKHLWAIEFAIKWGTIKDIEKFPPIDVKPDIATTSTTREAPVVITVAKSSYKDDDYTF